MWGYVEQALAARITRLTEFLENVGKIDVHPILLALQKSMAEAGTETLRNAARLDEDGEVDMLSHEAQRAKKNADKELNETAPLQYSNGKLIEKGAGGRSDRTEAAPQHKDWSFDEDNLLPPCLSKYEYASQVADLEIDGADEVEEINGLHEELPGNSKQKVSEEEVKLAWNTEASNGLTVSQRKNIKVVKDDADKDDVIKAPVQRRARAQPAASKRKRIAPTTQASNLPPVPPVPRGGTGESGAKRPPKKIKPTLTAPPDQLFKPFREYMLNIYHEAIPPEHKTFDAVLSYVQDTLGLQLGSHADVVSMVEAYRDQRAASSAFLGVNDTKLGHKAPKAPKPEVKAVLCVVCKEAASGSKMMSGPFLTCATCASCTHHRCLSEDEPIPGLLHCSAWRCRACRGDQPTAATPEVALEARPAEGEELLAAGELSPRGVFVGDLGLTKPLKPHQVEGIQFILRTVLGTASDVMRGGEGTGCLLAHACGTGKTLQAITAIAAALLHNRVSSSIRTCLVVVPVNVVHNWVNEWQTWAPIPLRASITVLESEKNSRAKMPQQLEKIAKWRQQGGVLVCPNSLFQKWASGQSKHREGRTNEEHKDLHRGLLNPGADMVVLDEGHTMKNKESLLAKGLDKVRTRRRVLLTGTPIQNNLGEYYVMLNWVRERVVGTHKEYNQKFEEPIRKGQDSNASDQDKTAGQKAAIVLGKLLQGVVHRRDHDGTLEGDLPPKQEYVISVRLSALQRRLYSSYIDWLHTCALDKEEMTLFRHNALLTKVWSHPSLLQIGTVDDDPDASGEEDNDIGAASGGSRAPSPQHMTTDSAMDAIPQLDGEPGMPSLVAPPNSTPIPSLLVGMEGTEVGVKEAQARGAKSSGEEPSDEAHAVFPDGVPSSESGGIPLAVGGPALETMSTTELKALISSTGRGYEDCLEKDDLIKRATEARKTTPELRAPVMESTVHDRAGLAPPTTSVPVEREEFHPHYTWTDKGIKALKAIPSEDLAKMGKPSVGTYLTEQQASYAVGHLAGNPTIAAMKADKWVSLRCPTWRQCLEATDDLDAVEHSGKLQVLLEVIQAAQEMQDKVLVFSQYTGVLNVIQSMLESCVPVLGLDGLPHETAKWQLDTHFYRIQGSTDARQRQKLVEAFNRPESQAQLCLLSTKAAGMGINLTAANRVVIFDSSWNPSQDAQALCRTYRYGQTKPVFVYRLLAAGTMEEKIYQRAVMKLGLSLSVIDEKQTKQVFTHTDDLLTFDDPAEEAVDEGPGRQKLTDQKLVRDNLLAGVLLKQEKGLFPALIKDLDEHDSLLQEIDHDMTHEEQRRVWDEYRAEEDRKALEKEQKKLEKEKKAREKKEKEEERKVVAATKAAAAEKKKDEARQFERARQRASEQSKNKKNYYLTQYHTAGSQIRRLFEANYRFHPKLVERIKQAHIDFKDATPEKQAAIRQELNNLVRDVCESPTVRVNASVSASAAPSNNTDDDAEASEWASHFNGQSEGQMVEPLEVRSVPDPSTHPVAQTGVKEIAPEPTPRVTWAASSAALAAVTNDSDATETDDDDEEDAPGSQLAAKLLPDPEEQQLDPEAVVGHPLGHSKRKADTPPGREPETKAVKPSPRGHGGDGCASAGTSAQAPIVLD